LNFKIDGGCFDEKLEIRSPAGMKRSHYRFIVVRPELPGVDKELSKRPGSDPTPTRLIFMNVSVATTKSKINRFRSSS
jgi:hypothetical protein